MAASFSSDGRRVLTVSNDEAARVWDAETGKAVSEPMRHVESANFSADGRRIITAFNNTPQVWDAVVDLDLPLPLWVPELAEAIGGRKFNESGLLVPSTSGIVELRKRLLALKGDDFWSRFGRWFFMRGPQRTISPDSKITIGELERLRADAENESAEKSHTPPTQP